jgi:hypothetical protein
METICPDGVRIRSGPRSHDRPAGRAGRLGRGCPAPAAAHRPAAAAAGGRRSPLLGFRSKLVYPPAIEVLRRPGGRGLQRARLSPSGARVATLTENEAWMPPRTSYAVRPRPARIGPGCSRLRCGRAAHRTLPQYGRLRARRGIRLRERAEATHVRRKCPFGGSAR